MMQAFIVVLREGFESFLIVAITLAYLKRTGKAALVSSVYWGVAAALAVSALLGWILYQGANGPIMEGTLALVAAVLISWLVIHMWRTAPYLKRDMEQHLSTAIEKKTSASAYLGVFLFTVLMVAREGMETALLLLQIHEPQIVTGAIAGAVAAAGMSYVWLRFSHLINLKLFFQGTAVFLLFFVAQVLMYAFHEYTEAGILPNSEYWHAATEPYSHDGIYGKWFSIAMVAFFPLWMLVAWAQDRFFKKMTGSVSGAA